MTEATTPTTLGRYLVTGLVGRGSMGVVYKALDPSLDRTVSIKTLDKVRVDPDFVRRFMLEAKFVASLSHPHIVPIHDIGEDDEHAYIVMPLITGGSLQERLAAGAAPSLDLGMRWMGQLLAALDHVHRAGIVHRDVKPGNVLLDQADNVKLTDFGVARAVDRVEQTLVGTIIGTPKYMAPEQLGGDAVSAATDLFAAALLAYRLFTGRDAFQGSSVAEVMRSVMLDEPTPPSRLPGSQLPPRLDAVFARALAKDPAHRYGDALTLDAELRGALSEGGPSRMALPGVEAPSPQTEVSLALITGAQSLASGAPQGPVASTQLDPSPSSPGAGANPLAGDSAVGPPPATDGRDSGGDAGRTLISRKPLGNEAPQVPTGVGLEGPVSSSAPLTVRGIPASMAALPGDSAPSDGTVVFGPAKPLPPTSPGTAAAPSARAALRPEVQLVAIASPDSRIVGRIVIIDHDAFVIGRDSDCNAVVNDRACTRHHAEIRYADGRYNIVDLGSTNGTWLDGRSVPAQIAVPLMFGSAIRIGDTSFTFAHRHDTTLPDLSGQLVAGRYLVQDVMRASPKATVYSARVGEFGPVVALKLLSPEVAAYPGYRERLRQAAEVASRLQHPHICQLLDHGVAEVEVGGRRLHTPYLCHTLLAGGSLGRRLEPNVRTSVDSVIRWIGQLAAALGHAHRRGVVHGDLKPTSIALDEEDNAYLMDFAFSTAQPLIGNQPLFGAPAFMAPEVWNGAVPDDRSDQFSLAVIAYALLTGVRPFIGQEDPQQRDRNFRRGAPPAHEEARASGREELPRSVSSVLQRALAIDPSARHDSVEAFAGALERALRGGRSGAESPRVFISYQHEPSAGWAVLLARELKERHNIWAFVDTQRLDAAMQFPAKLAQAIDDCDVFVCLLAAGTLDSRWVREEIHIAHRRGRPMVPVFQESFAAPQDEAVDDALRALLEFDGVHLLDRRNIHVDHTIDDLARLVRGTLPRTGA